MASLKMKVIRAKKVMDANAAKETTTSDWSSIILVTLNRQPCQNIHVHT